mmetsp:Transcript_45947/g.141517  ORF Transcript_45947/g.141517 Transcript_45947/m.141517 type:complete len:337 (-) Transcript_45947:1918-2928(-)
MVALGRGRRVGHDADVGCMHKYTLVRLSSLLLFFSSTQTRGAVPRCWLLLLAARRAARFAPTALGQRGAAHGLLERRCGRGGLGCLGRVTQGDGHPDGLLAREGRRRRGHGDVDARDPRRLQLRVRLHADGLDQLVHVRAESLGDVHRQHRLVRRLGERADALAVAEELDGLHVALGRRAVLGDEREDAPAHRRRQRELDRPALLAVVDAGCDVERDHFPRSAAVRGEGGHGLHRRLEQRRLHLDGNLRLGHRLAGRELELELLLPAAVAGVHLEAQGDGAHDVLELVDGALRHVDRDRVRVGTHDGGKGRRRHVDGGVVVVMVLRRPAAAALQRI